MAYTNIQRILFLHGRILLKKKEKLYKRSHVKKKDTVHVKEKRKFVSHSKKSAI